MNKVPIAEAKVLSESLDTAEQRYEINHLPKDIINGKEYSDKIELKVSLIQQGKPSFPRTIRFTSPAQLESFIMSLIRAYFILAKITKYITTGNYNHKRNEFLKRVGKMLSNA